MHASALSGYGYSEAVPVKSKIPPLRSDIFPTIIYALRCSGDRRRLCLRHRRAAAGAALKLSAPRCGGRRCQRLAAAAAPGGSTLPNGRPRPAAARLAPRPRMRMRAHATSRARAVIKSASLAVHTRAAGCEARPTSSRACHICRAARRAAPRPAGSSDTSAGRGAPCGPSRRGWDGRERCAAQRAVAASGHAVGGLRIARS
eukprot:791354-Prymnesium_polylepis.3